MPHVDVVSAYDMSTPESLENLSLLMSDLVSYFVSGGSWPSALGKALEPQRIRLHRFGLF